MRGWLCGAVVRRSDLHSAVHAELHGWQPQSTLSTMRKLKHGASVYWIWPGHIRGAWSRTVMARGDIRPAGWAVLLSGQGLAAG